MRWENADALIEGSNPNVRFIASQFHAVIGWMKAEDAVMSTVMIKMGRLYKKKGV